MMDKNVLKSVIVSLVIIAICYLLFGSYFEDNEALYNAFIQQSISYSPKNFWVTDTDFLLWAVCSRLHDSINFPFFSLVKIVFCASFLLAFVYFVFYSSAVSKAIKVLGVPLICLILIESFIFYNNVRLCILLTTSAFWLCYDSGGQMSLRRKVFVSFLFLSAILSRMEVAVIMSALFLFLSILFFKRYLIKQTAAVLLISLSVYGIFHYLMVFQDQQVRNFQYYERAIFDNGDFVLGKDDVNYFKDLDFKELDSSALVLYGKFFLLNDDILLTSSDYSSLVKHKSTFSYVFRNSEFIGIYSGKVLDVWYRILENYNFLMWQFILLVLLSFVRLRKNHRSLMLVALSVLVYLGIPLILLIFSAMPNRFICPYLCVGVLFGIYANFGQIEIWSQRKLDAIVLCAILYLSVMNGIKGYNTATDQRLILNELEAFESCIMKEHSADKKVVLSHCDYTMVFHGKLFSDSPKHKYIMADAYVFNFYEHVFNYSKDFFEDAHSSLKERYIFMVENDLPYYSNEFYVPFIHSYLLKVHKLDIDFAQVGACQTSSAKQYKLSLRSGLQ